MKSYMVVLRKAREIVQGAPEKRASGEVGEQCPDEATTTKVICSHQMLPMSKLESRVVVVVVNGDVDPAAAVGSAAVRLVPNFRVR